MKRLRFGIAIVCLGIFLGGLSLYAMRLETLFFWNTTESTPLGLYAAGSERPDRGDYVVVDDPFYDRRLMKRVVAVPGDHLVVDLDGVHVNGVEVSGPSDRPDFQFNGSVPEDMFFGLGEGPRSWDSRVLGFFMIDDAVKANIVWQR